MSAGRHASLLKIDTGAGNFNVRLTLNARHEATPADAWVFFGHGFLAAAIPDFKGSCEISGTVHVEKESADPDNASDSLFVEISAPSLFLSDCRIAETDVPTIHVAGNPSYVPGAGTESFGASSRAGWVQFLPYFLSHKFSVAHQRADVLFSDLNPGDYVLLPFVDDDESAEGSYRERLTRCVEEVRNRQALPVLVTPLAENTWEDGRYRDTRKAHAATITAVGERSRVPVLDLHARSTARHEQEGQDACAPLYLAEDPAQTTARGAWFASRIIASELRRVCGWEEGYQALAEAVEKTALTDSDPAAALFS
ncbi:MAG: hypothetical protein K6G16_00725 [Lachnospiraceae bacterium]|nr:hypothetical protein [Lachnospiraceae bacterium]